MRKINLISLMVSLKRFQTISWYTKMGLREVQTMLSTKEGRKKKLSLINLFTICRSSEELLSSCCLVGQALLPLHTLGTSSLKSMKSFAKTQAITTPCTTLVTHTPDLATQLPC